ncbi:hypothetical protein C4564_02115 [Candidatus Microgenomates bacterium]|nr:MAG: hypothetical protein C4564_02115 [Candidatus Microgenomates bacterium]
MGYGFAGHIGLAKETTWGSGQAITDYVKGFSENVALNIERFDTENIFGRFASPDDSAGARRIEGELVLPGHPVDIGHFLRAAFGTLSGSVVASGFLWSNEFTLAQSDFSTESPLPPYTLELFRDVTSSHLYRGVVVNRLDIAMAPNQDVRFSVGVLGRSTTVGSKSTPSYVGSPVHPFAFDTVSISIAGVATNLVEAATISIDNQLEGILTLANTNEISRIRRRGPVIVRFSGTIDFANLSEYTKFVQQSEQTVSVNVTKANSFQLSITLPRFVYTAWPTGIPGRERLTASFDGIARYSSVLGYPIKATLTTTKSDY